MDVHRLFQKYRFVLTEEIHENKEQIEISKAYERMPNPALLATQEFMDDKVYFRKNEEDLFR